VDAVGRLKGNIASLEAEKGWIAHKTDHFLPEATIHCRKLRQVNCVTRRIETAGHLHQVGEGVGFHFLHHLSTMCLHRGFTNA